MSTQADRPTYRLGGGHHTPEVTTSHYEWEGYDVQLVLRPVSGRKAVTELHVSPIDGAEPAGPLTSVLLRTLPLGRMRDDALEVETLGEARSLVGSVRRDERFYAEVAEAYVNLLAVNAYKPVEALAHAVEVPVRTVHAWLHKARKRGLLTSAGAGQAGGELTERARALLDDQDDNDSNGGR